MQHPDKKVLLDMFSTMTKIRLFEGELQKFFAAGKIPGFVPGFFVPDFPAAHMLGVNSSHDGRNRHESASELLPSHAAASALSVQTTLPVLSADAEGRFIAANPRQRAGVAAPRVCGAVRRRFAGGCERAIAARRRYGVR